MGFLIGKSQIFSEMNFVTDVFVTKEDHQQMAFMSVLKMD
jgi:hypothetical protein